MELSKIQFYSTTADWIQTIKADFYKRIKYVDGRKGGKTEKGTAPGLINDKRETSNQSIKLSSTHAVWKGRIWWVIRIDKDNQGSTVSTHVSVKGPTRGVPAELDTQLVESAIYQR